MKDIKNLLIEIYYRLSMKSPETFKKVRKFFVGMVAICGIISQQGLSFSLWGYDVAQITAIFSAGAAIMTFIGVKDTDALDKKLDK
jgi:multidrug transporter EmrE-like cation transporter